MPPAHSSALRDAAWRPSRTQLARLSAGLVVFGVGEALLVLAALGNSPWTVLAAGVAKQTGLGIGESTVLISGAVLLLWLPLRERPGFGTVANAVVIGLAIGATLAALSPPSELTARLALVALGIALVGVGSGLYINAALGRGPRDGLMTALHHRTGRPIALVRTTLEVGVLIAGVLLGGLFGIGTVAFALFVGPAVHVALRVLPAASAAAH